MEVIFTNRNYPVKPGMAVVDLLKRRVARYGSIAGRRIYPVGLVELFGMVMKAIRAPINNTPAMT